MSGKAVIIGAGPAGTATALALQAAGWEPEVFEAYDEPDGLSQGAFLTVAVNGLDALAAFGADSAVRELGFPTGRIRFANGQRRDLGSMPIGPRLADGTQTRTVRRADLYASLADAARARGIPVHHRRRLTDATANQDGVQAIFADGTAAVGDLLVGADGLRSRVRELIDPAAPSPRYSGLGNVGAFVRVPGLDVSTEAADGDYRMIWGRRCFFGYTVSPDGEVWWFANPPGRAAQSRAQLDDHTAQKARLVELLSVDAGIAAQIVDATTGPILFANQDELPRVGHWQRARMVLVGDAAHAVSPATGQGVSLAWEDAAVLASDLKRAADVPRALAAYEQQRRERVDRVIKWGKRMGGAKAAGPVGAAIRDRVMPWVMAQAGSPKAMAKQAWLFEHHIAPLREAAAR